MKKRKIYAKEGRKIISLKVLIDDEKIYRTIANYDFVNPNIDNNKFILLVSQIINCTDDILLSHLICELLNNNYMIEENFLYKILSCFSFEESRRKIDLKKAILNYEYRIDNLIYKSYFLDDILVSKRIKKLPFVKKIN